MVKKLIFTTKSPHEVIKKNPKKIFNFLNMYSLYLYNKEKQFYNEVSKKHNIIFPDSKQIARYLRTNQQRGPTFTKDFLSSNHAKKLRHFFIANNTANEISKKTQIPLKNIKVYTPPHIKELNFPNSEKLKINEQIKKFKPAIIWVGIGNPKQEILSNQLYEKYACNYINIGAALDFLLENKKEAPKIWTKLGIEWLYRLLTDFKYSRKKVIKSFIALKYLRGVKKK